jgi:ATP-dependent DNA helicase RecG
LAAGEVDLAIGTHALFQDDVQFSNLALVLIDEQHRFGVDQRLALREKGVRDSVHPHQLIMTATPIPRTLAMTAYADLDTSVIDELPPGRTPVETAVIPEHRRDEVVQRVREACLAGQQTYWVCPLIDESELLESQSATETAQVLTEVLPDLSIGLIHGRLKSGEKDEAMSAFVQAQTHVLVATTVIEVGVDVPNANLMVIENAERMGLSQLHQLRGRVGRGTNRAICILLYQAPLSRLARERLSVMRRTTDGFEIAQRDLELRGPGEVLGTRQTGLAQFRIADLHRNRELLPTVGQVGRSLMEEHLDIVRPLVHRWLGAAVAYADA